MVSPSPLTKDSRGHLPFIRVRRMSFSARRVGMLTCVVALWCSVSSAQHGDAVTQSVTIEVQPVSKLYLSGNPGPFLLHPVIGSGEPVSATDASTTYSIVTNQGNMKITVSIDRRMPEGTTLSLAMESKAGISQGLCDVSAAIRPVTAVTNIARGVDSNQKIRYQLGASEGAGTIINESRTLTLTLTN